MQAARVELAALASLATAPALPALPAASFAWRATLGFSAGWLSAATTATTATAAATSAAPAATAVVVKHSSLPACPTVIGFEAASKVRADGARGPPLRSPPDLDILGRCTVHRSRLKAIGGT